MLLSTLLLVVSVFLVFKYHWHILNIQISILCYSINPVTGRYETDKKDPFEGMSDEQKEYEAMKLVDAMDKLQR